MIEQNSPLQILLVEDNPTDVLVTRMALESWNIPNQITVLEDGEQALDFIYRRGDYKKAERPDLILLDLNLPKRSGIDVLSVIRQNPSLQSIIVVVVSTSDSTADIRLCNDLGAKLFIVKPIDYEEYIQAICSIQGIVDLSA
jgi:CheY-like chemotaxis protein